MQASIIIPTFNEAARLPCLLDALAAQTTRPREVIVADAGSTDGTRELAEAAGCVVVGGGPPAVGRNAGAAVASGEMLAFLDADVRPTPDFLHLAMAEFERAGCVVATCLLEPLEPGALNLLLAEAANLYLQLMRPVSPHAPGSCLLCLRVVHEAIGGFDETLALAEDHDYVRRAAEHGPFCVFTSVTMPTSFRRVETEGLVGLALKYLYSEIHALAGIPIRSMPFEYQFGVHGDPADVETASRSYEEVIARLRAQRQDLGDPLGRLSDRARGLFDDLVRPGAASAALQRIRERLEASDIAVLDRYLKRRLHAVRGIRERPADRQ